MDEFTIRIPRERQFTTVAGLVVGGIAARHDVTLDALDDLQLALDSLLEQRRRRRRRHDRDRRRRSGDRSPRSGRSRRRPPASSRREAGESLGLRRLLDTVVDDVALCERDGGAWVELRKGFS